MKTKQVILYIVENKKDNTLSVFKYLSKVESFTSILKTTLSKHFNRLKTSYNSENYVVHKASYVDLEGFYKNNFPN
jgi:hypothetical protein